MSWTTTLNNINGLLRMLGLPSEKNVIPSDAYREERAAVLLLGNVRARVVKQ